MNTQPHGNVIVDAANDGAPPDSARPSAVSDHAAFSRPPGVEVPRHAEDDDRTVFGRESPDGGLRQREDTDDGNAFGQGDPFATAAVRRRVLEGWAASPARFREDANAEEDAARGAYRDRLVVELLQNAVDAAHAAGVECRVLITLSSGDDPSPDAGQGMLEIANTGTAISAPGVESLSTLRASAKRDAAAVGRFGVGFAAVLAVSDSPSIVSWDTGAGHAADSSSDRRCRGVGWSKQHTVDAISALDVEGLDAELARRGGAVPVLRLPLPLNEPAPPPAGYDTVVRLPLRDHDAAALARALIAGLDPTLPLVMPGLAEITIVVDGISSTFTCVWTSPAPGVQRAVLAGHVPAGADGRWVGRIRRGLIPAHLLADRPVEERGRTGYEARAMVREDGWPAGLPRLVRAPQPTDELLSLPVLASVDLPLEPSRRHTVAGPLRDWLMDRLAETVVDLAVELGTTQQPAPEAEVPGSSEPQPVPDAAVPDLLSLIASGRAREDAQAAPPGPGEVSVGPLAALELVPTGLPRGEADGRLRDTLARLLPQAPMFPGGRRGSDCVVCDLGPAGDPVTALLASPVAEHRRRAAGQARPTADNAATHPGADHLSPDHLPGDDDRGMDGAVDGLLPAAYGARRWRPALDLLGVRRIDTAGVVEILRGLDRPAVWWARAYAALANVPDRDALGALPVPLAAPAQDRDPDGDTLGVRMVTGPRGVLLPTSDLDVVALVTSGLPLRVVHPDACTGASRDILRTLGAVEGTPAGVLRDGSVHDAIADTHADADPDPDAVLALADAVLALVRDADFGGRNAVDELPWLADLLLADADGEFSPAGELLIADGPLDRVLAEDAPFSVVAEDFARQWPVAVLEAVGVLRTFAIARGTDVRLDPDEAILLELDDSDAWVEDVTSRLREAEGPGWRNAGTAPGTRGVGVTTPPTLATFSAVRDLELVDPACWPDALAELAKSPMRGVVMHDDRRRMLGGGASWSGGHAAEAGLSYTRWWLSRHALLPVTGDTTTVLPPPELALPGADPLLDGLFAPAAPLPGVDVELLRRLGCRLTLSDVLSDRDALLDLLDRIGDSDRDVPWRTARALYVAAVEAAGAARDEAGDTDAKAALLDPPLTVRTPQGIVPTSDAVIVDAPDLLPLLGAGRGALRLPLDRAAEASLVLGVPLASTLSDCEVLGGSDAGPFGRGMAAEERAAPDGTAYLAHPRLIVADLDGAPTGVPWRVVGGIGGEIHVDAGAGTDALARALAWRSGTWERRHAIAETLRDPVGEARGQAEADLDCS